ncbi:hypothetical protein [Hyphococcus sp.]|jgi:hypothetical protein|uniref:hypothetical protein n=1 Tax=Hyphococcus sp. TaxID=2038636 RepID=UPI003D0D1B29
MSLKARNLKNSPALAGAFPWARCLLVAAIVAAALRAVTPVGYMIGHDEATGRIAITICTGTGEKPAFFNPETGEVTEDDGAPAPAVNEAGQCPFASFSLLYAPENAPDDLGLPAAFAQSPLWRAQSVFHDSQSAVSPPPSRGPPLHA